MSVIDELVHGCIDMHVHMGPDPYRERRVDAIELAVDTKKAGMCGVVMKSHSYPTASLVYATKQMVKDVGLFGSIALNDQVGGLNPAAVEVAGRLDTKVVWMPTSSAKNDRFDPSHAGRGITVLDENCRLAPVVYEILELVRQYDMVLATGHLSLEESFAVIDAAREKGIDKIIYTHPMSNFSGPLTIGEQVEAARRGAFIEHCLFTIMPNGERMDPGAMVEAIKSVGPARCLLSTDFGQSGNPSPPEGMRLIISTMLQHGLGKADVELMVRTNPAQLLGLG